MDRHFLLIEDWYSYERISKDLCHKLMLLFALTTLPCATAVKAAAFPAHRTQPVADKRTLQPHHPQRHRYFSYTIH